MDISIDRKVAGCMFKKRKIVMSLLLAGSGLLLAGCYQGGTGGHMMSGGMMGGGMMGQVPIGDSNQSIPDQESPGAQLFKQYCSQCHALPATTAHTAQEWQPVVARMKQNILSQGKALPDNEQLGEIIDYLQRNAR